MILAVILVVVGPTRLPGAARKVGRAMREFRQAFYGLGRELSDMNDEEIGNHREPDKASTTSIGAGSAGHEKKEGVPDDERQ